MRRVIRPEATLPRRHKTRTPPRSRCWSTSRWWLRRLSAWCSHPWRLRSRPGRASSRLLRRWLLLRSRRLRWLCPRRVSSCRLRSRRLRWLCPRRVSSCRLRSRRLRRLCPRRVSSCRLRSRRLRRLCPRRVSSPRLRSRCLLPCRSSRRNLPPYLLCLSQASRRLLRSHRPLASPQSPPSGRWRLRPIWSSRRRPHRRQTRRLPSRQRHHPAGSRPRAHLRPQPPLRRCPRLRRQRRPSLRRARRPIRPPRRRAFPLPRLRPGKRTPSRGPRPATPLASLLPRQRLRRPPRLCRPKRPWRLRRPRLRPAT